MQEDSRYAISNSEEIQRARDELANIHVVHEQVINSK